MNLIVLSDFDGTIIKIDTLEYLLKKFALGDWLGVEHEYESGNISLEECMKRQMSMLHISKKRIIEELEKVISFRSGFAEILEYCKQIDVPFIIVSAGLDFIIRHFLISRGWIEFVEIHAFRVMPDEDGIRLFFPEIFDSKSTDFKEGIVKKYKREEFKVVYVGNGLSDFNASKEADYAFSIKDSKLSQLCKENGILHEEVEDFYEVTKKIELIL